MQSVKKRKKKVTKECVSFASCVAQIVWAKPSGTNSDDHLNLSTSLFNNNFVSIPEEDCGREFKFLGAWKEFKYHAIFLSVMKSKPRTSPVPSGVHNSEDSSESDVVSVIKEEDDKLVERPIGRRKSKHMASKEDLSRRKLKVTEDILVAHNRRNEIMQTHF